MTKSVSWPQFVGSALHLWRPGSGGVRKWCLVERTDLVRVAVPLQVAQRGRGPEEELYGVHGRLGEVGNGTVAGPHLEIAFPPAHRNGR